jgi:trk system potassium uptake protein TrkH
VARRYRRATARLHPEQVVVIGFGSAVLIGTALLMLPISTARGAPPSFVDALFTATSAVCVTGLTVLDTPTFWSPFGQVVSCCSSSWAGSGS